MPDRGPGRHRHDTPAFGMPAGRQLPAVTKNKNYPQPVKHLKPAALRLWRGKLSSGVSALWDEMLATDVTDRVPRLALPAYFFHGIYDYTVNYQLAKTYAATLQAPRKGFYTFYESAHSPMLEEPWKAQVILRQDVLAGTSRLADASCR